VVDVVMATLVVDVEEEAVAVAVLAAAVVDVTAAMGARIAPPANCVARRATRL
jgi:hypothetical protein